MRHMQTSTMLIPHAPPPTLSTKARGSKTRCNDTHTLQEKKHVPHRTMNIKLDLRSEYTDKECVYVRSGVEVCVCVCVCMCVCEREHAHPSSVPFLQYPPCRAQSHGQCVRGRAVHLLHANR